MKSASFIWMCILFLLAFSAGCFASSAPNITLNHPIDRYNTSSHDINFNFTVTDDTDTNLTCNLTIDGVVNMSDIDAENGTSTNYTVDDFSKGTYFWNITCLDDSSNHNTSETRTFTINNTPPNMTYINVTEESVMAYSTQTVNVTADDYDHDMLNLTCCISTSGWCSPDPDNNSCNAGNFENVAYPYSGMGCDMDVPAQMGEGYINCTVTDGTVNSTINGTNFTMTEGVSFTSFSIPPTTNFSSAPDIENVCFPVVGINDTALVQWNSCLNASGADLDTYINLSNNLVEVDAENLDTSFNSSANISLFNLSYVFRPLVYKDGSYCNTTLCNISSYQNNTLNFTVSFFSSYSSRPNSLLSIWDQSDPEGGSVTALKDQSTKFYANYSNLTGMPINSSNTSCNITFSDGSSSLMDFNESTYLYEYSRVFTSNIAYVWNVSCNGTFLSYERINSSDTITIECVEDWSCTSWSECSGDTETRTCTDANSCGTTDNKPAESQDCEEEQDEVTDDDTSTTSPSSDTPSPSAPSTDTETLDPVKRTKTWDVVTENESVVWNIADFPVTRVSVTSSIDSDDPEIDIEISDDPPSATSAADKPYRYLTLSSKNLEAGESSIIFRVENSWMESNGYSSDNISLARFDSGWEDISTRYLNKGSDYHYFESVLAGFGDYAIKAKEPEEEIEVVVGERINESEEQQEAQQSDQDDPFSEDHAPKESRNNLAIILSAVTLISVILFLKFYGIEKIKDLRDGLGNEEEKPSFTPQEEKEILEYFRKTTSLGFNHEDIKKQLYSVGWPEETVDEVYKKHQEISSSGSSSAPKQETLKSAGKSSSPDQADKKRASEKAEGPAKKTNMGNEERQILDYIRKTKKAGFSDKAALEQLYSVGWSKELVDKAYKLFKDEDKNGKQI